MTAKYDPEVIEQIKSYNAWQLADRAGSFASNGEALGFFTSIRDNVLEAVDYVEAEDWNREMVEDYSGKASEIADGAPSIWTATKWDQFAGTRAYQEDPTELGFDGSDMEQGAGICLYMIAQRLVTALALEIQDSITDSDDE